MWTISMYGNNDKHDIITFCSSAWLLDLQMETHNLLFGFIDLFNKF